jgi:hypothetical protein
VGFLVAWCLPPMRRAWLEWTGLPPLDALEWRLAPWWRASRYPLPPVLVRKPSLMCRTGPMCRTGYLLLPVP